MKKIVLFLLTVLLIISCFTGCAATPKAVDADAVLAHLLSDISYDAPLIDSEDNAFIYFPGLPVGASVKLYISSSGYYPDEVGMITLADKSDADSAMAVVNNHLGQLRTQFQNYIPEEVATIDNAVTQQFDNHIFVVITSDYAAVKDLFSKADQLTPVSSGNNSTVASSSEQTESPTTIPVETEPATTAPPETEPVKEIPVLQSKSGTYSVYKSGMVKVDNSAFEPYAYDAYVSGTYAKEVSEVADALAGKVNVYCMPIPTAISVILPDDIIAKYSKYVDQGLLIDEIFGKMSDNVIGVNCYQNLMLHRDEYLYYRTDYHWNGPAAYYAYETYCKQKGFTPYTMEQREVAYFDNFLGVMYSTHSGQDPDLSATPDTVVAYYPYSKNATMFFIDNAGTKTNWPIINDVTNWAPSGKYLCYAGADQPYAEFHNPDVTDGSVLIIVKESYGNVLLSYLVDHYSVIYEIDYRYWNGSLVDLANQVGATDMLFANNMTMISAGVLVGMLAKVTH